ncbi:protein kinase domain-containing protein [Streptomyces sp. MS2.AVA.5]|uniref:Protein kinase n=1 Tax=Streptomyces achmelvichensis TaxID=3134111 RepID=A0ACC6PYN9_9ACTN
MTSTASDLPPELRAVVEPTAMRLVLDRRGSTVWEVQTNKGRFAVKLGYPAGPQHGYTALAPAREATVLHDLGRTDVSYGTWDRGTWNVQPWWDGADLWRLWEPFRAPETAADASDYSTAASCARALDDLHAHGWVHGDVQPAHFVIGAQTRLIDLALARGGDVPSLYDFPFPGCLVHYEAPEIARSVLATGTATPTPASDVYALGASLLISATGKRVVPYADDAEREVQRQAVVDGERRDFALPGVFGETVTAMLCHDPAQRPTVAEVCEVLEAASLA